MCQRTLSIKSTRLFTPLFRTCQYLGKHQLALLLCHCSLPIPFTCLLGNLRACQVFAPLVRDGRMEKFYWKPDNEELGNILHHMYKVLELCTSQ